MRQVNNFVQLLAIAGMAAQGTTAVIAQPVVRHLPVLKGGELVGILSERDVRLVESFRDVDPEKVSVEEAFTPEPYIVSPSSPLSDVCEKMVAHRYGCALVCDNKKLVDGGLVRNFPVKNVKEMGADIVIGSNVTNGLSKIEKIKNPIDELNAITNLLHLHSHLNHPLQHFQINILQFINMKTTEGGLMLA